MSFTLNWLAGEGWKEFFKDKGDPWDSYGTAEAYRQRHLIDGFRILSKALSRR